MTFEHMQVLLRTRLLEWRKLKFALNRGCQPMWLLSHQRSIMIRSDVRMQHASSVELHSSPLIAVRKT